MKILKCVSISLLAMALLFGSSGCSKPADVPADISSFFPRLGM